MPQTSYPLVPATALAGMLADTGPHDIVSKPASEPIPPGVACVLDAGGTVSLPKTATADIPSSGTGSLVGVSMYLSSAPAGGYQIGDMVPLLRKGRIWAAFYGTGVTHDNSPVNISHASANTGSLQANRGYFTDAAGSTTAGHEVTAFTKGVAREGVANTLALVDINLP